jgi:hypothetical protein
VRLGEVKRSAHPQILLGGRFRGRRWCECSNSVCHRLRHALVRCAKHGVNVVCVSFGLSFVMNHRSPRIIVPKDNVEEANRDIDTRHLDTTGLGYLSAFATTGVRCNIALITSNRIGAAHQSSFVLRTYPLFSL